MKTAVAVGVFALLVACARASPLYPQEHDEDSLLLEPLDELEDYSGVRLPRATCDLLSFTSKWISINHSACAAHCIALLRGYKGGSCRDGVCHCRH